MIIKKTTIFLFTISMMAYFVEAKKKHNTNTAITAADAKKAGRKAEKKRSGKTDTIAIAHDQCNALLLMLISCVLTFVMITSINGAHHKQHLHQPCHQPEAKSCCNHRGRSCMSLLRLQLQQNPQ